MPSCLVLFHRPDFDLAEAAALLTRRGMAVEARADRLFVRWKDGPELRVSLAQGETVRREAEEIAAGTEYKRQFGSFEQRFEIGFDDLAEILDESNTLIEVQATLQDATGGYLFNTWNDSILPPG